MRLKKLYLLNLLLLLGLASSSGLVGAASDTASGVTNSYNAESSVLTGMLVGFKSGTKDTTIPLSSKEAGYMIGVVVPVDDAPIVLTGPQTNGTHHVLVAASGRHQVLVTNQSGPIKTGDYITVSSADGLAMKATSDNKMIIGRAAGGFDGQSNVLGSISLKNSLGRTVNISVGQLPFDIQLAANPLEQASNGGLNGFLSKTANTLTDKPVSLTRVYASAVVLITTLLICAMLFYGSARSSIVAIGRNPLAKNAIGRGLAKTISIGLLLLIAGVLVAYLILSL